MSTIIKICGNFILICILVLLTLCEKSSITTAEGLQGVFTSSRGKILCVPIDNPVRAVFYQPGITNLVSYPAINTTHLFIYFTKLIDFPNLSNISATLKQLNLNKNLLREVPKDRLEMLGALSSLSLTGNALTDFPSVGRPMSLITLYLNDNPIVRIPHFGNVAKTLTYLSMQKTHVTRISMADMTQFLVLQTFNIQNSRLVAVPDCSHLPRTLVNAYWTKDNPVKVIPTNFLSCVRGPTLDLSATHLTQIPNLCRVASEIKTVRWSSGSRPSPPLHCDCGARWLVMSQRSGVTHSGARCGSPPHLAGRDPLTLTLEELVCDGKNVSYLKAQ